MKNKLIQLIAFLIAASLIFEIVKITRTPESTIEQKELEERFKEFRKHKKDIQRFDVIQSYLTKPYNIKNGV
jgi:large-conductance mechanosensitive channel